MIVTFLRQTSIHGLRYVVEADGIPAKATWALSVMASIGIAVYLIILSVKGWSDSPSNVSNAGTAVVIGNLKPPVYDCQALFLEETNLPMITVCPRNPNSGNMLFSLLESRPTSMPDVASKGFKVILLDKVLLERQQKWLKEAGSEIGSKLSIVKVRTLIAYCRNGEFEVDTLGCFIKKRAACELIKLLQKWLRTNQRGILFRIHLFDYIKQQYIADEKHGGNAHFSYQRFSRLTVETLSTFLDEKEPMPVYEANKASWKDVVDHYHYFLPMVDDKGKFYGEMTLKACIIGKISLLILHVELQDNFTYPDVEWSVPEDQMASFLAHAVDRGMASADTTLTIGR